MRRAFLLTAVAVAFCRLAAPLPAAAEIGVRIKLEPDRIGLEELATLTIETQGGGLSTLRFRPEFELANFEVAGGPYQYEDLRLENGRLSRSFRLSWQLRPLAVGKAGVRSAWIEIRGERVELPSRTIAVQAEPTGQAGQGGRGGAPGAFQDPFDNPILGRSPWGAWPPAPRRQQPGAFLRAEVSSARPFVGEQVLYTVYLYSRGEVSMINPKSLPEFRGFWVQDVPDPEHLPTDIVMVGGERFGRVALTRKALFPLRAGTHRLEPARYDALLRVVERGGFFSSGLFRPEEAQLATDPVELAVQPLPPAPPGFAGAVGRLALAAALDPPDLRLGEAATLTLRLEGTGHLQGMPAPRIEPPPGVEVLPPQQGGKDEVSGTTVRGHRTWSFAVVPRRPGEFRVEVPPIPFFDPASGGYRLAAVAPLRLAVGAAPAAAPPPDAEAGRLHPVRAAARSSAISAPAGLGRIGSLGSPRHLPRLWPWLFALPWVLALVVGLARRYHAAAPGGGSPARRLAARLERIPAEPRARQAAVEVEAAWREFLAERWEVPPGTPPPAWPERLTAAGADPAAARELARLADDLHCLRHAPQLSATAVLRDEALDRSHRLLRRLR